MEHDHWMESNRTVLVDGLRALYYQVPAEVWDGIDRRIKRGDCAALELAALQGRVKRLYEQHPEIRPQEYEGRNHRSPPPPDQDG